MKNIAAEVTNKKTLIGKIMSMFLATMTHYMVHFRSCYKTKVSNINTTEFQPMAFAP